MTIFVIFLCVLFSLAVATFAGKKGLSAGTFFLVSVLLSPIVGFVIALLMEPKPRVGADKKCPDCAEIVKAEARVCRFCGCRFEAEPAAPSLNDQIENVPVDRQSMMRPPGLLDSGAALVVIVSIAVCLFVVGIVVLVTK